MSEHDTYVFVVTPEGHAPEVTKSRVTKAVLERLAQQVGGADTAEVLRDPALATLVRPALTAALPGDLLYFVPHNVLHRIPLHAVQVDGAPVIDRHPVVTVPSASALRYCRAKRKGRRRSALIVADPAGAPAPLVFAREQALAIAEEFDHCRLVSGPDASRESLIRTLRGQQDWPDILHFTAHGVYDPQAPMQSGIELSDGRLTAADILGLSLDVDLVTLGACESGVGASTAGDDMIGLAWSLFYAGTPTALVSLWRVDELSTSMLLTRFYTELQAGLSKADALRVAQMWLRGLSSADVLVHADTACRRLGDEPGFARIVREHEAWLRLTSDDFAGALALYRGLAADPALPHTERERLELLQTQTALLSRRGTGSPTADRHPFADPRYWAPFLLTGDWV
ncbi:CHAT domain-containing protein [Streptomyces sp. NPDC046862]|uniref:CHAT domain-containing protein n=1 Tax=Streptomyces sp. NPDC046862 TaxID=3154603 RepID=UPI0034511D52